MNNEKEKSQQTINASEAERQLPSVGNNFKETDEVVKDEYIFRSFEVEMMEEYGEYGIKLNELIKFYQKEDGIKSENDENLFLNNLANLLTNNEVTFKHKLQIVEKLTFVRQCFMS